MANVMLKRVREMHCDDAESRNSAALRFFLCITNVVVAHLEDLNTTTKYVFVVLPSEVCDVLGVVRWSVHHVILLVERCIIYTIYIQKQMVYGFKWAFVEDSFVFIDGVLCDW